MLTPYKNRILDPSKPVEMYRCLNRRGYCFSLRQEGKVVAHSTDVVLKDCKLIVNKAGKTKALRTNERNVHAFVRGYISDKESIPFVFSWQLLYNPFAPEGFCIKSGGVLIEINSCKTIYIENKQVLCQI